MGASISTAGEGGCSLSTQGPSSDKSNAHAQTDVSRDGERVVSGEIVTRHVHICLKGMFEGKEISRGRAASDKAIFTSRVASSTHLLFFRNIGQHFRVLLVLALGQGPRIS